MYRYIDGWEEEYYKRRKRIPMYIVELIHRPPPTHKHIVYAAFLAATVCFT